MTVYVESKLYRSMYLNFAHGQPLFLIRARKLYTSARIYEWKFGKGEWKLPFASPTGRVDFFGFVIIFDEKKNYLACFTACKSNANTVKKDRSVGLNCH